MKPSNNASVPIFILAGGLGTRLSEETSLKPKPMVEIGGIPILIHIMRSYYSHGFNDFVICGGYRLFEIKKFIFNYSLYNNNFEIDRRGDCEIVGSLKNGQNDERWRIRLLDTGADAMTGARVARAYDLIQGDAAFDCFGVTYGDGLTDANLEAELKFHQSHQFTGTVLGVKDPSRFGSLQVAGDSVLSFREKPPTQDYINGGFFFFKSEFRKYLNEESDCILERAPLFTLAKDGQLKTFKHEGFWHPMDTLRDKNHLEELWNTKNAPWVKGVEDHAWTNIHHRRNRVARG